MTDLDVSLVIPTYNERENIGPAIQRASRALTAAARDFEIIVVDDDSGDGTAAVVQQVMASNGHVRLIRRSADRDLSRAVVEGWRQARGTVLAVMDGDLQHPPEILPLLLESIARGRADIAIGSRHVRGGGVSRWSLWRRLASWGAAGFATFFLPGILRRVKDPMSGYFVLKREVLDGVSLAPRGYKILLEVLMKGKFATVREVPYVFEERLRGGSKLGPRQVLEFFARVFRLSLESGHAARLLKYLITGALGAAVTLGCLWLLRALTDLPLVSAYSLSVEFAILHNFIVNELWTFADAAARSPGRRARLIRLLRFNGTCVWGAVFNVGTFLGLREAAQLPAPLAALAGVGVGYVWNYGVNANATWQNLFPPQTGGPGIESAPRQEAGLGSQGLLLLLFALVLYVGVLEHEFVWDDHHTVVQNPYITQPRYIGRFFTEDVTSLTSGSLRGVYYRPVFWLSLLLDYRVWGLRPAGFYLTNLLLYAVTCLLVFRLARVLLNHREAAFFAALLFAVHPAHVESVAWVSGRVDLPPAIGVLLALLWYRAARLQAGGRRWLSLIGSVAAFAFGLLAKESAASLPFVLLWFEIAILPPDVEGRRAVIAPAFLRLSPFFIVLSGLLWFRWTALTQWSAETLAQGTVLARIPGSLELVARYLLLALLPYPLQPVYALSRPMEFSGAWPLAGLAVVILGGGLVAWWKGRWPVASFALGWFFLALVPVLDLVPVSPRPLNFAARHLFIPSVALSLLAGAVLARWLGAEGKDPIPPHPSTHAKFVGTPLRALTVLALLAGTLGTLTYRPVFQNDLRLFTLVSEQVPRIALGHRNRGLALLAVGQTAEGLQALERAVVVEPDDPWTRLALAGAYVTARRPSEGLHLLDGISSRVGQQMAYVHTRAAAHLARGEWSAAAGVLESGLRRYPEAASLYFLLGHAFERMGELPRAEAAWRRVLELTNGPALRLEARHHLSTPAPPEAQTP